MIETQRDESATRPTLLFLCQTLPFPPDGGVNIRAYNIMRLLSRTYNVKALCFYRRASRSTNAEVEASLEGLRRIAEVQAFPIPQDRSRLRLIWDHLRSVLTGRVYTRFAYESRPFTESLRRLLESEQIDLVHMDSLDLSCYLPLMTHLPIVCTHHNIESDLLRRRAFSERFPLGAYLRLQAALMKKEEKRWCGRVSLNAVVSEADGRRMEDIAPDAAVTVVPNGVDTGFFRATAVDAPQGLVFVGGYSWYPNRGAMAYFADHILPLLRRVDPAVPVTWVGVSPEPLREEYARNHGIQLTGFVDDVRPYIDQAACYIVPLRVGGGTRLKILDAWAMGKAVVSTSIGCEGLDARDGVNILIRDSPEDFAAAVRSVLEDPLLRQRLGEGARATAEQVYEWDVIGRTMTDRYLALTRIPKTVTGGQTYAWSSSVGNVSSTGIN